MTSSERVKAAALGLERQDKDGSMCLYSHRTAWALLSLGQGHDHPGPGLPIAKSGLRTLMHSHISKSYLLPLWPSSSSVSSPCSPEKGATGTGGCSVGGDRLVDGSLEGCASSPALVHQQDSSVKPANAGQKNCGALILQRSKPSPKRRISCYANFLIYFYFRESGSKSA